MDTYLGSRKFARHLFKIKNMQLSLNTSIFPKFQRSWIDYNLWAFQKNTRVPHSLDVLWLSQYKAVFQLSSDVHY